MNQTRQEIERREEETLPPWALRSGRAARRRPLDPEGRVFDYRTEYQRDRDRILNSRSFRRLRQKMDGGAVSPVDPRRDRLTHTLEVTQISRTIARALSLNEDLTEAIALGHDLGCPPFGSSGARALDRLLGRRRRPLQGGFRVPAQSLRVVDLLEKRYEHEGLNLTHDVREGIFKQDDPASSGTPPATARPRPIRPGGALSGIDPRSLRPEGPPSLEAQAVAIAGRIATLLGGMDDALREGLLEPSSIERVPLVRELLRRVGARYPARSRGRLAVKANLLHRGLTHLLVTATIQASSRSLRSWCRAEGIADHEAFLAARDSLPARLVAPRARIAALAEGLRDALHARLGAGAAAAQAEARSTRVLGFLLEQYLADPRLLDDYVLLRFREAEGGTFLRDLAPGAMETEITRRYHGSGILIRLVADHIAGMTDAYARFEYGRLSGPGSGPAAGGPRH